MADTPSWVHPVERYLDADTPDDATPPTGEPRPSLGGLRWTAGPSRKGASHKRRPSSPSDRPPVGDEPGSLFDDAGPTDD